MNESVNRKADAGRCWRESASPLEDPSAGTFPIQDMGTTNAGVHLRLFDMHCHLDRMANADEVARDAAASDMAVFCTTVSPTDTLAAQARFGTMPNIRVGVGLHPWWVADGRCGESEGKQAAQLAASSRFIGEVGLDFGPRRAANAQRQLDALEAIVRACAGNPVEGRVLSVHAIRSASEAIDVLEHHGLTASAHCVFHWFSGTSDQLTRALDAGCFFSVSERMLATKRGREYARQIPLDRLLLETDAPNPLDTPYSAGQIESSLIRALHELAHIRGTDEHVLSAHIAKTSSGLLGLQPHPSHQSDKQ